MTDDLDMGAVLNEVTFEETIQACIEAGNDLAMICHRVELVEKAAEVIATLPDPVLHDALVRIEATKKKMAPPYALLGGFLMIFQLDVELCGYG